MSSPGSGSKTGTYVQSKTQTIVVPLIVTQSIQIAQYFTADLEELVRLAHVDLADIFQIPSSYYQQDTKDIILMLHQDISHMLRDRLITGIHLLLCDPNPDTNTGFYHLRYHAHYAINTVKSGLPTSTSTDSGQSFKGLIKPPKEVLRNVRFAILIDWEPSVGERWREVRRPDYCFDWVPEMSYFDATTLIHYRDGYMSAEGANIVNRNEDIAPIQ